MAFGVGQAVTHVLQAASSHTRHRVVIGKDTRISGYMLESALGGRHHVDGRGRAEMVGVLPTPGIAYITESMRADAGFVVSASHNPYQDNGIKVFSGTGYKLSDAQEERSRS
jgi:phosphoglucosamine mutase